MAASSIAKLYFFLFFSFLFSFFLFFSSVLFFNTVRSSVIIAIVKLTNNNENKF